MLMDMHVAKKKLEFRISKILAIIFLYSSLQAQIFTKKERVMPLREPIAA